MMVCFIDRILSLLDKHQDKSAVIATSLDWAAAFDRQDPTKIYQARSKSLTHTNTLNLSYRQEDAGEI